MKVKKMVVKKDPPVKKEVATRKKPIVIAHKGKTPKKAEKASDNTRHYMESIPDFKKRRNAFRATQAKKRAATAKKKK